MVQALWAGSNANADGDGKRAFYRALFTPSARPDLRPEPPSEWDAPPLDELETCLLQAYPVSEAQKQQAWQSLRLAAESALEARLTHTLPENTPAFAPGDAESRVAHGRGFGLPLRATLNRINHAILSAVATGRGRLVAAVACVQTLLRWYVLDDTAFTRASHCPHHEYAHLLSASVPIKGGGVFKGGYAVVMVGFTLA